MFYTKRKTVSQIGKPKQRIFSWILQMSTLMYNKALQGVLENTNGYWPHHHHIHPSRDSIQKKFVLAYISNTLHGNQMLGLHFFSSFNGIIFFVQSRIKRRVIWLERIAMIKLAVFHNKKLYLIGCRLEQRLRSFRSNFNEWISVDVHRDLVP